MINRLKHNLTISLIGVVAATTLIGCASLVTPNYTQTFERLRPGQYQLDPEHAYVHFKVEHLGLSTVVGRFNQLDASLDFDPESIDDLKLEGRVDMQSVDMNNESLEKRLRGSDWFDVANFPEASFTTQSVTPGSANQFRLEGNFTLRGISRPLILDVQFKGGADNILTGKYTVGFAANASFLRSDYGIDSLGGLVADEVFVEIHAEFQRAQ
ncbi:MAG: YceI family protein [Granulosicoccus sp.]|nr:YceI family protein [Granulosicoccus sp.]